jgi:hypothetical protein
MNTFAKSLVLFVGAAACLAAVFGFWYNIQTLTGAFSDKSVALVQKQHLAFFYPAFYIMSAICVACYGVLLACGVDLLRGRLGLARLLTGVVIFEVIYFFSIAILWMMPGLGMSVAAATGVANGGLMLQFVVLFPLWGPVALWWARGRLAAVEVG